MTPLEALADLAGGGLVSAFAVFVRIGAAMALLPGFGEPTLPQRVRLALALAFTAICLPAVATDVAPLADPGRAPGSWLPVEALAGLAIGAVLRLFVIALQVAGAIAAQATSLAGFFGGSGGEPQPAIGHLAVAAGLALAALSGLPLRLAEYMILSYDALPPGRLPPADGIMAWALGAVSQTFALAFALAAPLVLASVLYNVALGVINRAMPQLMVALVGAPALMLGGLVLIALSLPEGIALWHSALVGFLDTPFGTAP